MKWAVAPIFFWRNVQLKFGQRYLDALGDAVHGLPQVVQMIEPNATALGLEIVDVERSAQGLLRILIDRTDQVPVTVDDCERLTRQLQHAFEVDQVAYERLEVSSPGLDRPLKKLADFQRFAGQEATVKLRSAVAGRRAFEGVLVAPQAEELGLDIESPSGRSILKFKLGDVEKARLVPKFDFKRKVR
jgi:ribosome maturation factor RimP